MLNQNSLYYQQLDASNHQLINFTQRKMRFSCKVVEMKNYIEMKTSIRDNNNIILL